MISSQICLQIYNIFLTYANFVTILARFNDFIVVTVSGFRTPEAKRKVIKRKKQRKIIKEKVPVLVRLLFIIIGQDLGKDKKIMEDEFNKKLREKLNIFG